VIQTIFSPKRTVPMQLYLYATLRTPNTSH